MVQQTQPLPRGLRNNNPLNIRHSPDEFQGEDKCIYTRDKEFKRFKTIIYGYRAACCIIRTYLLKDINTVRQIVARWCPDESAPAYTDFVCRKTGLKPHRVLRYADQDNIVSLVAAMSEFENGVPADFAAIRCAYLASFAGR